MDAINRVLLAIDDESDEIIVIQKGLLLAKQHNAKVKVCIVINDFNSLAKTFSGIVAKDELEKYIYDYHHARIQEIVNSNNPDNIPVEIDLNTGISYIEIIQQAFKFKADLIIQSTHSTKHSSLLFSSADWRLIRKSPVPVWVINNNEPRIPATITVAIDVASDTENTELNKSLLSLAANIAHAAGSRLLVLSSWQVYGESSARYSPFLKVSKEQLDAILDKTASLVESKQKTLKNWLQQNSQINQENISWYIEKGDAREIIPAFVNKHEVGLLILSTVNRTGVPGLVIGNTAETVLSKVKCSVLTVKPSLFESPVLN